MKTRQIPVNYGFMLAICLFFSIDLFAQAESPKKLLSFKSNERMDTYMKEHGWKMMGEQADDDGEKYHLYRKKSYGSGYVYMAVTLGELIHYQKFGDSKQDYAPIMSYSEFLNVPQGKQGNTSCIHNEVMGIINIIIHDPENHNNVNKLYGYIPGHEEKGKTASEEGSGEE